MRLGFGASPYTGHFAKGLRIRSAAGRSLMNAIQDWRIAWSVAVASAVIPTSGAWGQCFLQKLQAPQEGERFGLQMDVSGDTLVVADFVENDFGIPWWTGRVHVYRYGDGGGVPAWTLESVIPSPIAPSPDGDIRFGSDVDIDGDTLVVGDIADDAVCPTDILCNSGAAYVDQRDAVNPTSWNQVTKLVAPDAAQDDHFGGSVVMDDDIIAIGARLHDGAAENTGAVYVYQRDSGGPGNWGFVTKLTAFDANNQDGFGGTLALEAGTLVVVSRDTEDALGNEYFGAAYVYGRDSGGADNWGLVRKLSASDRYLFQGFAFSGVSISGDTIVAGTWADDLTCEAGDSSCGSVYLFERDAGGPDQWGEVLKITASDVAHVSAFGVVALSGDRLLVGSPGALDDVCFTEPPPVVCAPGAAYLFERNAGGAGHWGEVAHLQPDDIERLSQLGYGPVLDGNRGFIAAPSDRSGPGQGAVYTFSFDACDCPSDSDNDRQVGVADFFAILASWGDCQSPCPPDPDGDGLVGVTEFLAVLTNWGCVPRSPRDGLRRVKA